MEKLNVNYLNDFHEGNIKEIFYRLNTLERHSIGEVLWQKSAMLPKVSFSIGHSDHCILLKFFVEENTIRVTNHSDNSPVHLDSCVEFFISFNGDEAYYNFEFNSIGTCSFGYGKNRLNRIPIQQLVIDKIKRQAVIDSFVDREIPVINWELSVLIPIEVFVFNEVESLPDVTSKANFFKCGDALPEPHYLAWKKVVSDTPNFHLPEFFQSLEFKKPVSVRIN